MSEEITITLNDDGKVTRSDGKHLANVKDGKIVWRHHTYRDRHSSEVEALVREGLKASPGPDAPETGSTPVMAAGASNATGIAPTPEPASEPPLPTPFPGNLAKIREPSPEPGPEAVPEDLEPPRTSQFGDLSPGYPEWFRRNHTAAETGEKYGRRYKFPD